MPIEWVGESLASNFPAQEPRAVTPAERGKPHDQETPPRSGKRDRRPPNPYEQTLARQQTHLETAAHARQLMQPRVVSVRPEDPIAQASDIFSRHSFHHLPVKNAAGRLVGLFSDRDLLKLLAEGADPASLRVEDVMTRRILTATPETSLREIARVMVAENINCLPIVDKQQKLAGILTATDILRYLVNRSAINLWI